MTNRSILIHQKNLKEDCNFLPNRRKSHRFLIELPIEYRVSHLPKVYGGLVVNLSELGILIRSIKDMEIGSQLKLAVLFPEKYELKYFEGDAKVIRKDLSWNENWEGYEYGLRFIQLIEEDERKLKQLLSGPLCSEGF